MSATLRDIGSPIGTSYHEANLADEPFIGYKEVLLFQPMKDGSLRKAGIAPKLVCRVDEPSAVAGFVRAGLGVALIGAAARRAIPRRRAADRISRISAHVSTLLAREERYLSGAARKFRDFIVDYFAAPAGEA